MTITRKTRMAAVVLLTVLVLVALFSSLFAARHVCHNCVGPGCGVCCLIDESLARLSALSLSAPALLTAALRLRGEGRRPAQSVCLYAPFTPVSLKVKLSD